MIDRQAIINELDFKAVRSSGSGGQHVNKTSSKVELRWNLQQSLTLNDKQKERLKSKLESKLTTEYELILQCSESRSQHKNKALVIERFFEILEKGLKKKKKRKPTKISKEAKKKRLENKRKMSQKKEQRKPPEIP